MSIAAVILAAGGSTRMGRSKQLLEFRGETLVARAARTALRAGLSPVMVVVGSNGDAVRASLRGVDVRIIGNEAWEKGIGTSIGAGVRAVEQDPEAEAVLIMLADQPDVDSGVLAQLVAAWRRGAFDAAACVYGSRRGVPAVAGRGLFERLKNLPPARGAKEVLEDPKVRIASVDVPAGLGDIDTPEDYQRLLERERAWSGP